VDCAGVDAGRSEPLPYREVRCTTKVE
jgi:hypothetical protein